jgi:maltooligosyltrehalose trehalohydrolase
MRSISTIQPQALPIGATRLSSGAWQFHVWAPNVGELSLHILGPKEHMIPMERSELGYCDAIVENAGANIRYLYRLDGTRELPDPASRFQPDGVHAPSQTVDVAAFHWTDNNWKGIGLDRTIFYELHVGTFTPEGTFDAAIHRLDELAALGVTTIELMPIAQFPGGRNWGYDGVYPFAPQNTYGGPAGLQCFVDAAHARGLSVALDVVYNHLGPEGNYSAAFGPYFTERYRTPWGMAVNYDDAGSDQVRRHFISNALYWLEAYHIDALRLDAIHGIFDFSALHILAELKSEVISLAERLGRPLHLIAESDLNDARVLHPADRGGYALDAQWSDDFHHSVHTLLTHEKAGYYEDFGSIEDLVITLQQGWRYTGQHSKYRQRRHGNSPAGLPTNQFVVCNQNHDQVGNRARGDRISTFVDFESLKLAAGATILSPFVPLLFMGEEYGETAPFAYFTSHGDPDLVEAVRRGRRAEFEGFGWGDDIPDPHAESTFAAAKLNRALIDDQPHGTLLSFYRELIRLRRENNLGVQRARTISELGPSTVLQILNADTPQAIAIVLHFGKTVANLSLALENGRWDTKLYSGAQQWRGPDVSFPASFDIRGAAVQLPLGPRSILMISRASATSPHPAHVANS